MIDVTIMDIHHIDTECDKIEYYPPLYVQTIHLQMMKKPRIVQIIVHMVFQCRIQIQMVQMVQIIQILYNKMVL